MSRHWTLGLLTCGPLLPASTTWASQLWMWRKQRPRTMTLVALGIFGATTLFAAWNFFYYDFRPPSNLPPWKDSEILNFGVLFPPVVTAMLLGLGAVLRGAPKWLIAVVEIGLLPLLFLSFMAAGAV
jgi:hypothetical protein